MAANEYIRTVNITPLGTSYSWDTPPNWITIVRVGTTDDWTITVAPNSGVARNATLTVRHANTSTIDTIEVTQAGNTVITPTSTPAPTAAPTSTPIPTVATTPVSTPIPTVATTPVSTPIPTVATTPVSTPVPTAAATPVPTPIATASATPVPTPIATVSETPVSTPIATVSETPVSTPKATTLDPTPFPTLSPTATSSSSGGTGGGGCHIAGELITMANGETKAIENIKIGDALLSFNVNGYSFDENAYLNWSSHVDNFEGEFTSVSVTNIKIDSYDSYYDFNNGSLKITYEHPILIKNADNIVSWKTARDSDVGEYMLNENNEWVLITSKYLISKNEPFTTWTLDVETEDVYFANGILVHNAADEVISKDDDSGDGFGEQLG
jgi:hypothetical protein